MKKPAFYKTLSDYCATLESEFPLISEARKAQLLELSAYISRKKQAAEPLQLTVICTHNSRRSHIGQLWLKAAAEWYGVEGVHAFSGGTEATAFHPNAVAAMRRAGFRIEKMSEGTNPEYKASLGGKRLKMLLFSKKYDHPANPESGFAAIMVCSEADAGCPFVAGADGRFALPFEDPKISDGSPYEAQAYDERCRQIGREMFFVMKNV